MYDDIFNQEDMQRLQDILRSNKETITTAESCTGGLIASMITELSGSSDVFNGSIVSYSNEVKMSELGVKQENLEKDGAVSVSVVEDMLDGVKAKFKAQWAIAVSGVAGPTGGSQEKPVGTVVIGISIPNAHKIVEVHHFDGNRKEVQIQTAKISLKKIINLLEKPLTN
ncbi:CinA family protein [Candidatus Marinarcus aquaticus]|uniref:Damage-inducible protein CinA n=1 Tax=Candidatus Marinarcus aquaticus TaxID=2044504 RepID=A0A4Q0XSL7_9BACT|nr:CinA family protein [Candidatus Marinarcus aquaticus]RXJ60497.1 damage-inducible protein CinA [Candidatus Marinarcus aquaticus]